MQGKIEAYIYISCLDDCSRKVASKWSERKRIVDVLDVLEEWIVINGKPKKVMRDNGKQFTSKTFRHFLKHFQQLVILSLIHLSRMLKDFT